MNEDGKIPGSTAADVMNAADAHVAHDTNATIDATVHPDASPPHGMGIAWDVLEARLAFALSEASGTALPSYRRPWFASLVRQGREAETTGRAALAAHCRDRLEREFAHFGIAPLPETAVGDPAASSVPAFGGGSSGTAPEAPETGDDDVDAQHAGPHASASSPGAGPAAGRARATGVSVTSRTSRPAPTGRAAAPRPPSPLEALALRRDASSRARLRELLDRHAARLSPEEVAGYMQALEATGAGAAAGHVSVTELRRRLLDRLMRAARYRRQAVRLAAWAPAPPSGVAGPYNDHRTLEELLHRITRANPLAAEWAAEFFDIHADMKAVRDAYNTIRE